MIYKIKSSPSVVYHACLGLLACCVKPCGNRVIDLHKSKVVLGKILSLSPGLFLRQREITRKSFDSLFMVRCHERELAPTYL